MKFGLLYEMQRPFDGIEVDWNALYRDCLLYTSDAADE